MTSGTIGNPLVTLGNADAWRAREQPYNTHRDVLVESLAFSLTVGSAVAGARCRDGATARMIRSSPGINRGDLWSRIWFIPPGLARWARRCLALRLVTDSNLAQLSRLPPHGGIFARVIPLGFIENPDFNYAFLQPVTGGECKAFRAGPNFLDNNGAILTEVTFTNSQEALVLFSDTCAQEPGTPPLAAGGSLIIPVIR